MAYSRARAQYETALAAAHRALARAEAAADTLGDDDAVLDLWHMRQHLTNMGRASIGEGKRENPAQMRLI